jgi:hypothetical protein
LNFSIITIIIPLIDFNYKLNIIMKYTTIMLLGAASATKITQKWTEPWGPGEDGIIDALTPPLEACRERLWEDPRELGWQMDMFSRTCDRKYYDHAWEIAQKIKSDLPRVNAWELLDKSFAFSRIRRYDFVNDNMDMLEHFQDNLNMNRSNLVNVENFIRVCKTVNQNFSAKFHDGEFDNPAEHDPRQEALEKYNEKINA